MKETLYSFEPGLYYVRGKAVEVFNYIPASGHGLIPDFDRQARRLSYMRRCYSTRNAITFEMACFTDFLSTIMSTMPCSSKYSDL